MKNNILLSLCIPTNGVIEWVFPVLDSIFSQNVDDKYFEVVVADNGNNPMFKSLIREYKKKHNNIIYIETNALPFINEIEAYKNAKGELIKFVNHRTLLVNGALLRLIDYARNNLKEKPITYFSTGVIPINKKVFTYSNFNDFIKGLWYWSSWSTGMSIWKDDFEVMPKDTSKFNELFPHTNILFFEKKRKKYIIDNTVIFDEIPQGKKPKGTYDLYFAFGIEYPRLIEELLKENAITKETYDFVLDKNLDFISQLFWEYNLKRRYCSYDLSGLSAIFGIYYTKFEFLNKLTKRGVQSIKNKIFYKKE